MRTFIASNSRLTIKSHMNIDSRTLHGCVLAISTSVTRMLTTLKDESMDRIKQLFDQQQKQSVQGCLTAVGILNMSKLCHFSSVFLSIFVLFCFVLFSVFEMFLIFYIRFMFCFWFSVDIITMDNNYGYHGTISCDSVLFYD